MMMTNENAKTSLFPRRSRPWQATSPGGPTQKRRLSLLFISMSDKTARRRFYIKRFVSATITTIWPPSPSSAVLISCEIPATRRAFHRTEQAEHCPGQPVIQ